MCFVASNVEKCTKLVMNDIVGSEGGFTNDANIAITKLLMD